MLKGKISVSVSPYEPRKGLKLGHGKALNQLHFEKLRTINGYSSSLNCISADLGSNPNETASPSSGLEPGSSNQKSEIITTSPWPHANEILENIEPSSV